MDTPQPVTPRSELLDSEATASFLGLNPRTLGNWRLIGRGPRFIKVGNLVRYRLSDLEAWLDQQTHLATV